MEQIAFPATGPERSSWQPLPAHMALLRCLLLLPLLLLNPLQLPQALPACLA